MYRLIARWYVERFNTFKKISFLSYNNICLYDSIYFSDINYTMFTLYVKTWKDLRARKWFLYVIKLGVQKVNKNGKEFIICKHYTLFAYEQVSNWLWRQKNQVSLIIGIKARLKILSLHGICFIFILVKNIYHQWIN